MLKPQQSDILAYALLNSRVLKTSILGHSSMPACASAYQSSPVAASNKISDNDTDNDNDIIFQFSQHPPPSGPLEVPLLDTPQSVSAFIQPLTTILFDCDGVLYRDTSVTPNASRIIQKLQKKDRKKVFFVTNSSAKSREVMCKSLSKKLNCNFSVDQMVPSSWACAQYIKKHLPNVKKAYVIGGAGIFDELRAVGVQCIGGPTPDDKAIFSEAEIASWKADPDVDAIICGMAIDFSYKKLCEATMYLQNKNVCFISTNNDAYDLIGKDARHQPANGALVAAIEFSSGRQATTVGKPSKWLYEAMVDNHNLDASKTLMIGDRMDTDVKFGKDHGMKTALVMSGCTTGEMFGNHVGSESEPLPTVVIPHIGLFEDMEKSKL